MVGLMDFIKETTGLDLNQAGNNLASGMTNTPEEIDASKKFFLTEQQVEALRTHKVLLESGKLGDKAVKGTGAKVLTEVGAEFLGAGTGTSSMLNSENARNFQEGQEISGKITPLIDNKLDQSFVHQGGDVGSRVPMSNEMFNKLRTPQSR